MTLDQLLLHDEGCIANLKVPDSKTALNLLSLGITPDSRISHVAGHGQTRLFYADERFVSLRMEEMKEIELYD